MAEDPDACDPTLAPIVSCHLYAGHCLMALGEEAQAYMSYEKAATGEPHALVDFPSVQLAARQLLDMRDKPTKKASTEPSQNPSPKSEPQSSSQTSDPNPEGNIRSPIERPDSLFLPSGIAEIPLLVSVRPGPQRKRPDETPATKKIPSWDTKPYRK
ncbi:hypothetical protein F4680DRAFT_437436 [Xylaria scruposa]|nr:hypothetical protein F4680DRAFT_437436 [Xylaria scruposa]